MTEVAKRDDGTVAGYGDFDDNIGLEDVGVEDLSIPRLRIVHDEGVFQDNLSGEKIERLRCVLLGVVKQRIMWHPVVDDKDLPECKSPDFEHGFPLTASDTQPKDKFFPWDKSNFDPGNFPAEDGMNGLVTLPCASCVFKDWNKGDWKTPPCSEQHTYPLFYTVDDGQSWAPAMVTFAKTGIKPSRTYISSFASARRPLFTVETFLTLNVNKRGSVTYSIPQFAKGPESDRDNWPEYGETYKRVREVIRSAPRPREEDASTAAAPSDNANAAPAAESKPAEPAKPASPPPAATPPKAAEPAPSSTPAATPAAGQDDDMPF